MATGLSLSSTSGLTNGQRIIIASAKEAFEPAAPDPDLIESERIPTGSKQWDISTYARLTDAQALTEGVDLSSVQQLATNTLQLTPAEHGILVTLSNRLIRRQGDSSVITVAGRQIGSSLRRRMAKDVIALYDGFSKTIVGTGAAIDITHFRGAVAYLLSDNNVSFGPAPMPLHAALHIEQISDIIADLSDPGVLANAHKSAAGDNRTGYSAELMQRWWRGSDRLYGIPIFHSGNIQKDSTPDAKGAIFAKEALYMVVANDSDVTEEDDNSLRAREYGIFQEWAEGERADPHGVEVFSDVTATV